MLCRQVQTLRTGSLSFLSKRPFGSFELHYPVPPRYFRLQYVLDQRAYREKFTEASTKELAYEHREKVQEAIKKEQILFRGECLPGQLEQAKDGTETDRAVSADMATHDQIFFVFQGRDERDPHDFMKMDPIFQQGCVKEWQIVELDLEHKERDDELVLTGKF